MYVITGGGSGIGKALALALAARGEKTLIVGRRESILQETSALSPKINYLCADVSTAMGREMIFSAVKESGNAKALINNAGILDPLLPLGNISPDVWQTMMTTNVEAPLFLSQILAPLMPQGRVLNIGSGAAHVPLVGMGAYCVSKAALHMLTRCLQVENTSNLAFACVMPGIIDTDMQRLLRLSEALDPDNRAFYNHLEQTDKLISPSTVAAFISWLLIETSTEEYVSREWDIYETFHHEKWLTSPHVVPQWNEE